MSEDLADIVRSQDRPRYLASLFAPEDKRKHLFALYAFNAEICKVPGSVSEPQLGEIRLQYWVDTLDGIYGRESQSHPVAKALAEAIEAGDLPKHALVNLVNAHRHDLYADALPSFHDLEGYHGETSSALIQLAAMLLDRDAALACSEASGLSGVAYGIANSLAQMPRAVALKQCLLPGDQLKARGVPQHAWHSEEYEAALTVVIAELREKARQRLEQARKSAWTVKPSVMPAFLHVALVEPTLNLARRRGGALVKRGAELSQLRMQWLLWKAARSEGF